jgi:CheY-like chemotaxis protein
MARIVLIDDNADFRRTVALFLRAEDHEVVEAGNGIDGLRAVEDAPTDLIICDVLMPEMEGIEVLRKLAARPAGIPVITVSGGSRSLPSSTLLHLTRAFSAIEVLYKPFHRSELLTLVRSVLNPERGLAA